jgi:copper resistance protein D
MGLEVDAVGWRFVHFAALTVLLGAVMFRLRAVGEGAAPATDAARHGAQATALAAFDRWLWRLCMIAAAAALISSLGWLFATTVRITGDVVAALSVDVLMVILTETIFGLVWSWRLAMLAVLVVLLAITGFRKSPNPARPAIAILTGLALASLSGVGHAIANTGTAGIVHQVTDAIHLFAASVWLGGLVALARLLAGAAADPEWAALALVALPRFSTMALIGVGLVVASGIVNTVFLLDSPAVLIKTTYGRVLVAKIALVVVMIGLGALNRQVLLPRMTNAASAGLAPLRRSVAAEIALGTAVLVIVAALGTFAPQH